MILILMIDNYDSFTYNLVQYLGELGADLKVYRNDKISVEEIEKFKPDHIVISPGPCTPNEAGISMDVIRKFSGKIPILGVCLGHQAIGQVFGGRIVRTLPVHGKTSEIYHDGKTIFKGVENPLIATRYHSLIIERESIPSCFEISAETKDGIVMGVRHKEFIVEGVQFHPESILTKEGKKILRNFSKTRICANQR
jgi:anthranilate synthase/aminodeoxychorismate synthase-like glutamine amidotransferase